jgi:Trp operon repressor
VEQQLASMLANQSENQVDTLLRSLLSPVEHRAIAKRLTAILLLLQGRSASVAARSLSMSRAHVNDLAHRLHAGDFKVIKQYYTEKPPGWDNIAEFTESILRMGGLMPLQSDSLGQVMAGEHLRYREKYKKAREQRRVFRSDKTSNINEL